MDAITIYFSTRPSLMGLSYISFLVFSLAVAALHVPIWLGLLMLLASPLVAAYYVCALKCRGLRLPFWRFFTRYKQLHTYAVGGLKYYDKNWYVLQNNQWLAAGQPVINSNIMSFCKVITLPKINLSQKNEQWVFTLWRDELSENDWHLLHVYLVLA